MEVHFARGNFAEAGDGGLVLGFHERIVALHDLSGPGGSQDDEGKPVFFALETIFDGDACHIGGPEGSRSCFEVQLANSGSSGFERSSGFDDRPDVFAFADAKNVSVRRELEDANGKFVFAAKGDGGRVHDADAIDEEAIVGEFGEHLGVIEARGIAIVDAFDFGRLEESLRLNLHGAKRSSRVCREKRIAGSCGKDDDIALVEVPHGATSNVGFGDLADFDRRHHARRNTVFLERVLKSERVHDGGEHAHVIALGTIHARGGSFESAENISTSNDNAYLDPTAM